MHTNETHSERAAVIHAELLKHFKDVRELESRPESNGTFRRVFCLSAPTTSPYLLATFTGERADGSAVDMKMHGGRSPLSIHLSSYGGVDAMLAGMNHGIMLTRTDATTNVIPCLRAALRDDSPLAALIDEQFPNVAFKPAFDVEQAQGQVMSAIEQAVRQTTAAGQVVTNMKIDVGFHCNKGPEPITVTLNASSLNEPAPAEHVLIASDYGRRVATATNDAGEMIMIVSHAPGDVMTRAELQKAAQAHGLMVVPFPPQTARLTLMAAAQRCGLARIHTEPAPVEVPPSTMGELRRLGARTYLPFGDEGPRYDFDEVP